MSRGKDKVTQNRQKTGDSCVGVGRSSHLVRPLRGSAPADRFDTLRLQHAREMAEDYTELVLSLIDDEGEARVGRIAAEHGVSHVTAVRTLQRLEKDGYVILARHQPVCLTPAGRRLANRARKRHEIVRDFLIFLGVPARIAELDAEGAEHHMSAITVRKMKEFMKLGGSND
jgi:DtxR family manganese transport transcriptional regulator